MWRRLDALLPQTQCRRCGYDGCAPYARAMASGDVLANRCPPGGEATAKALFQALGQAYKELDPDCGRQEHWYLASIDEANCIGCVLCIRVCPVDAIVGAPKRVHTVLADECTACELCIPACPVDCIVRVPMLTPKAAGSDGRDGSGQAEATATLVPFWPVARAQRARDRYVAWQGRRAAAKLRPAAPRAGGQPGGSSSSHPVVASDNRNQPDRIAMRRTVEAALARVARRKSGHQPSPATARHDQRDSHSDSQRNAVAQPEPGMVE